MTNKHKITVALVVLLAVLSTAAAGVLLQWNEKAKEVREVQKAIDEQAAGTSTEQSYYQHEGSRSDDLDDEDSGPKIHYEVWGCGEFNGTPDAIRNNGTCLVHIEVEDYRNHEEVVVSDPTTHSRQYSLTPNTVFNQVSIVVEQGRWIDVRVPRELVGADAYEFLETIDVKPNNRGTVVLEGHNDRNATEPDSETTTSTTTKTTEPVTTDGPSEQNWNQDRVIQSLNVTQSSEYDLQTIWYTLKPHQGRVTIHVINESTGDVFTINPVTNGTGRTVWEDHRVEIYQVVEDERRLLVSGDVQKEGVDWSRNVSVENVSDQQIEAEAQNVSLNITNKTEFDDYHVKASGVGNGTVVAEYWAHPANESFLFTAGTTPQGFILLKDATIRVYYVRGDERRLIERFDPYPNNSSA